MVGIIIRAEDIGMPEMASIKKKNPHNGRAVAEESSDERASERAQRTDRSSRRGRARRSDGRSEEPSRPLCGRVFGLWRGRRQRGLVRHERRRRRRRRGRPIPCALAPRSAVFWGLGRTAASWLGDFFCVLFLLPAEKTRQRHTALQIILRPAVRACE
jgi:hypothetical protein